MLRILRGFHPSLSLLAQDPDSRSSHPTFCFIRHSQHADGGWHWPQREAHECADGALLSSLAALFAITQRIKHPFQLVHLQDEAGHHLRRGIEFSARPLLAAQPRWLILASWIQRQLFLPMLHEARRAAFSRTGMTKDKYFAWIPVMWTLANNTNGSNISTSLLFDTIRVSVLNFRADDFMETVVDTRYDGDVLTVRDVIEDVFKSIDLASVGEQPLEPA